METVKTIFDKNLGEWEKKRAKFLYDNPDVEKLGPEARCYRLEEKGLFSYPNPVEENPNMLVIGILTKGGKDVRHSKELIKKIIEFSDGSSSIRYVIKFLDPNLAETYLGDKHIIQVLLGKNEREEPTDDDLKEVAGIASSFFRDFDFRPYLPEKLGGKKPNTN